MDRTAKLIEGWLDGCLEADEHAELEQLLLESADTRREFWRRAAFHGQVREAAKMAFGTPVGTAQAAVRSRRPAPVGWMRRGMAIGTALLLAGGCGLGSVVTSLAWSYSTHSARSPVSIVVHEEGFESPPFPQQNYVPKQTDVWGGDETNVVAGDGGVLPRSGQRMLHFVSSHPHDNRYPGLASEIWRVVDVERFRGLAQGGSLRMELAGYFNARRAAPGTTLTCGLTIVATDSPPAALGEQWLERFWDAKTKPSNVAIAKTLTELDGDPATWQRLAATITVPPGARYLVLHCVADGLEDGRPAWLTTGQYLDDVSLVATPVDAPRPQRGSDHHDGGDR